MPKPNPNACYTATYPASQWQEIPCQAPSQKAYLPRAHRGFTSAEIVGGAGPDFSPFVAGHITEAEGSFDSASVSGTECSVACPGGFCPLTPSCTGHPANRYSLQLNTRPFTTVACTGSPTSTMCQGFEQFVYDASGAVGIQYWLEHYGPPGTPCPTPRHVGSCTGGVFTDGWCDFSLYGATYCAINAPAAGPAPATAASSLGTVTLTGLAASGGSNDSATVTVGTTMYPAPGANYFPDLGSQWQESEFNVFGDSGGDQAVFGTGTTLVVRSGVSSGTRLGPTCDLQTYTAESNNLTLVNAAPAALPGSMPALVFSESVPPTGTATATCADATSIGDTHLTTFSGLYYDFQATGDFVLVDSGPEFSVQNRQVSGAPRWPNAAVNSAVATRMGKTTVAVCLPENLEIDGKQTTVKEGTSLTLPSGVAITHTGNAYLIANSEGDSLRAQINDGWIDASVGLGHWPAAARGLLVNVHDDANLLATSDGAVLTQPISFEELYRRFGESWRAKQPSAISCAGQPKRKGLPAKPFFARDLERKLAESARLTCEKAGVQDAAHLEACILDVAVIGKDSAAKAFAQQRPPKMVAPF